MPSYSLSLTLGIELRALCVLNRHSTKNDTLLLSFLFFPFPLNLRVRRKPSTPTPQTVPFSKGQSTLRTKIDPQGLREQLLSPLPKSPSTLS